MKNDFTEFEDSAAQEQESGSLGFALEHAALEAMKKVLRARRPDLCGKDLTNITDYQDDYFYQVADKLTEIKR